MKKGKILNFEILWDTDEGLVSLAEKYIPMDIQKAADEGCTHVVGIVLNEGILPFDDSNLQQFFYNLQKQTNELGTSSFAHLILSIGRRAVCVVISSA